MINNTYSKSIADNQSGWLHTVNEFRDEDNSRQDPVAIYLGLSSPGPAYNLRMPNGDRRIEALSEKLFGKIFIELDPSEKDTVLSQFDEEVRRYRSAMHESH